MENKFPYENLRHTGIWQVVDNAIENLVTNEDIEEKTHRDYIVGYLCEQIMESGVFLNE